MQLVRAELNMTEGATWQIFRMDDVYYFHDLIDQLTNWGYQEGTTLFGFGYDFRQSNRCSSLYMNSLINYALSFCYQARHGSFIFLSMFVVIQVIRTHGEIQSKAGEHVQSIWWQESRHYFSFYGRNSREVISGPSP